MDLNAGETLSTERQIVGIMLAKNEDCFAAQAITNILEFCDHVILVDHASRDKTGEIFARFQKNYPDKIEVHTIDHPPASHQLLQRYVGQPVWVFGIDGDELYDPEGLCRFRTMLLAGQFSDYWMVSGNVLHADTLEGTFAWGYLTPPSRSVTKLYNFAAITRWEGHTPERLHGGEITFLPGFHADKKYRICDEFSWEESPLRCFHACFLPRSSAAPTVTTRENPIEIYCGSLWQQAKRWWSKLRGRTLASDWKVERYQRGPRVRQNVEAFFKTP